MKAGLFSENEGIIENPLVVIAVDPENTVVSPDASTGFAAAKCATKRIKIVPGIILIKAAFCNVAWSNGCKYE